MSRRLFVDHENPFYLDIPDDAKITFGPWSPPNGKGYGAERGGTLRIYRGSKSTDNVIAVFSGVTGFRDTSEVEFDLVSTIALKPTARMSGALPEDIDYEELSEKIYRKIVDRASGKSDPEDDEELVPVTFGSF